MTGRAARGVLALALLFPVACDTSSEPPSSGPAPAQGRISDGGKLVFGFLGEPASFDPYSRVASDLTYFLAGPVYPSLFDAGPGGSAMPDLATGFEVRSGVATVTLRRARWSDGSWITAGDVVRSVRRARPPSGFALMSSARVVGRRTVRLASRLATDEQWSDALARGTLVEPPDARKQPLATSGGPFVATRLVPGLGLTLERNPRWYGSPPHLDSVVVRFVDAEDILLALLDRGRIDAAAPPSTVNLDERLDETGIRSARVGSSERVYLDLGGAAPDRDLRASIVAAVAPKPLQEAFVRDDGRLLDPGRVRAPQDHPDAQIAVGVPNGDELLQLMQRVLQLQLHRDGFDVDLVGVDARTFYGSWEKSDPVDMALRRELVPGEPEGVPGDLSRFPMFEVDSFAAWRDGIHGISPSGTLAGPFWNIADWWRE